MSKRKRGPQSFKEKSKLPRHAGRRTQIQDERNDLRSGETLKNIRYGFKLMWQEVPKLMKQYGIGQVGSFDPRNCHGGRCWGWPKECKLTDFQAHALLFDVYKRRNLTMPQMTVVRKSLAYAYELTGGTPGGNFRGVKKVWEIVRPTALPKSTTTTLPEYVPTPEELKTAFTQKWTPESGMPYVKHCSGLVAGYHWSLFGLRSREDIDRVKRSVTHQVNWKAGWVCTDFVGGRAKLCGVKKGTRPWKVWMVCHCKGKQHVRPPANFHKTIDKFGNPLGEISFSTVCPLACLEVVWQLQDQAGVDRRCYGKWLGSGRFGTSNYGDVVGMAAEWFKSKGVCSEATKYDSNSGRKSLGRWTCLLNIPYEESFQLHGDLWVVWSEAYETEVPKTSFTGRKQSKDPEVACKALRRLARDCKNSLLIWCFRFFLLHHRWLSVADIVFGTPVIQFK